MHDEIARLKAVTKKDAAGKAEMAAVTKKDAAGKAGKDKKISAMEDDAIKEMAGTLAEMKRRPDYCENPFGPPSKDPVPTGQGKAGA